MQPATTEVLQGPVYAPRTTHPDLPEYFYEQPVNRVITLRDAGGSVGRRVRIDPTEDAMTGKLLGVADLSDEQARQRSFVVTKETTVEVYSGMTLDLKVTRDRLIWSMIQHSDFIAQNRDGCYFQNDDTRFFVEDVARDTDIRLSLADRTYNAEKWVRNLGDQALKDVGVVLGYDGSDSNVLEIKLNLIDKVRNPKSVEAVIKLKEDPYFKMRVFFYRLINANLIKNDGEMYRYQEKVIGTEPEHVIAWLNEGRNRDAVHHLYLLLNPTRRSNTQGGLPDDLVGGAPEADSDDRREKNEAIELPPVDDEDKFARLARSYGVATAVAETPSSNSNRIR